MENHFNQGARLKTVIAYKECLHNHGVDVSGPVLDRCGQFKASGPDSTPEAMVCADCRCHRRFHRQVEEVVQPQPQARKPGPEITALPASERRQQMMQNVPRRLLMSQFQSSNVPPIQGPSGQQAMETGSRLTREKSEQLRVIAERNNWKMFREYSEDEVRLICSQLGIKRRCLQDWISRHRLRRAANQAAAN